MIKNILARFRRKPVAGDLPGLEGAEPSEPLAHAPPEGSGVQPHEPRHRRVAILLNEFRQRLRRSPSALATDANPANAAFAAPAMPNHPQPALRSMNQWLVSFGMLVCAGCVVWTMVSAWSIVSAGRELESHRIVMPALGQFAPLAGKPLLAIDRLSPDLQRALAPNEDRLLRAVLNIANFENARAEQTLRATLAQVQAIVEGSAAEAAQVLVGDVIQQVNGTEAGYVWDAYKSITDKPLRAFDVTIQRGSETKMLTLRLKEGERFDMSNHGLLFGVPEHVRFIGQTDAMRLAEQLRTAYVESLPEEWRSTYVEGLLVVSNELVGNLSRLSETAYNAPSYLHTEDLLGWYHGRFAEAFTTHRIGAERLRARQSRGLLQLGWSLLAGGGTLLLALALMARRNWAS